jgi:hypothetical protein
VPDAVDRSSEAGCNLSVDSPIGPHQPDHSRRDVNANILNLLKIGHPLRVRNQDWSRVSGASACVGRACLSSVSRSGTGLSPSRCYNRFDHRTWFCQRSRGRTSCSTYRHGCIGNACRRNCSTPGGRCKFTASRIRSMRSAFRRDPPAAGPRTSTRDGDFFPEKRLNCRWRPATAASAAVAISIMKTVAVVRIAGSEATSGLRISQPWRTTDGRGPVAA